MKVETAKAIKASQNWDEIVKELDEWINLALQGARDCTPDRLMEIQARIRAYEAVKRLPQTVIDREE